MKKFWTEDLDRTLIELHGKYTIKKLAETLGTTAPSVRARVTRLGLSKRVLWTDSEVQILIDAYNSAGKDGVLDLDSLSEKLGRHKTNICRKAKEIGLETNQARRIVEERKVRSKKFQTEEERRAANSERVKKYLADNGHPRGALGMKHSDETKQKISQKSRQWNASLTEEQKQVIVEKSMRTRVANGTYAPNRSKTTWKAGWREIGDVKKYYRSRWEANYARYLEWLKSIGQIKSWSHESKTFWFSGVKRGSVSYLPDFCVVENNGSEAYHEVKGWMDDRSKTKIKRMAKYHPDVKLFVIQEKQYNEIKRKISSLIPDWE